MGKKGFSLIEIMVAVAVVSIGLIFVSQSFISIIGALQSSERYLIVSSLLESKFAELEIEALDNGGVEDGTFSGQFEEGGYEWEVNIEESSVSEDLKKVALTVFWMQGENRKSLSAVTLLEKKEEEENG